MICIHHSEKLIYLLMVLGAHQGETQSGWGFPCPEQVF